MDQTGLKRKGAEINIGEAEGLEPPKRRAGRGRGRGRGRANGRGAQRGRGKQVDEPETEYDWEDVCKEWELWQEERAAARTALDTAEAAVTNLENSVKTSEKKKSKRGNDKMEPTTTKKAATEEEAADHENDAAEPVEVKEKSFARRPPPKGERMYKRWDACRTAFEDKISLFVDHPSKYQDCLLQCFPFRRACRLSPYCRVSWNFQLLICRIPSGRKSRSSTRPTKQRLTRAQLHVMISP